MKKIMVLNLGSTSFKFKLFEMSGKATLSVEDMGKETTLVATGTVENIGREGGAYRISAGANKESGSCSLKDHLEAFELCRDFLVKTGTIRSMDELDAVGYKAVHGGPVSGARLVDESLLSVMESYSSLAVAHNPVYIRMMRQIRESYPDLKQAAYFETSFHSTMPLKRAVYGVPYEWCTEGIRRYGFHGSSHSYIAMRMSQLEPEAERVISIHLGGSSSLCAILNGESIACSMGATPQSGLFHNNRVGDFDVFCLPRLVKEKGGLEVVLKTLSERSGLLGLSGISSDLREVIKAAEGGNEQAGLAVDAFVDNIIGYVGMFTAYLKGLDAIVFTGGIGQNSEVIRRKVCEGLEYMGTFIDPSVKCSGSETRISTNDSRIKVWVIETNEELMVAAKTAELLNLE